ncbi:MAG TPA: VOC family protein [Terriglobales bacterium]|jgi:uncharacterized glyoxalase superfamily protein PhnB
MPKRSLNTNSDQLNLAIEELLTNASKSAASKSARKRTGDAGAGVLARANQTRASQTPEDEAIAPLVKIAAELRQLPDPGFKERLKADLQRSTSMTTATETPTATRTFLAPRIAFKDAAKAMEFYKSAFGAKETFRFDTGTGIPHAEMTIGDSILFITEEWPEGNRFSAETLGNSPVMMAVQVPDVDAFVEHAVAAGATLLMPPSNQFYGYRDATLADPFGYKWSVSTVIEEMSVDEMHRRFKSAMAVEDGKKPETPRIPPVPEGFSTLTPYIIARDAEAMVNFVKNAFGGEEKFRTTGSTNGLHAEVKVGDSMLMIGGGIAGREFKGSTNMTAIHLYVKDCDAAYDRALKAGGISVDLPRDQDYGERSATVKDAAGNFWYIATAQGASYLPKGLQNVNVYLHPERAEPMIRFLQQAFGGREVAKYDSPTGVIFHAQVAVGSSVIEMGEAHGKYEPMKSMFYLYVPNCDELYQRALKAGATSISEPKDQVYGDRSGAVQDVFGNQWYIATHIKDVAH